MMERIAIWQPWHDIGLEHLRLVESDNAAIADSLVIQVIEGRPVRLRYQIRVDSGWRVREADIDLWAPDLRRLKLRSDGAGRWTDARGGPLDDLRGCVDIDISATPFTNTLPIRRVGLEPGEDEEILVAYIRVPELTVKPVKQRYTCLERGSDGCLYRYEGLDTGFVTNLPVDPDGLVVDYPGVFRRLPLE